MKYFKVFLFYLFITIFIVGCNQSNLRVADTKAVKVSTLINYMDADKPFELDVATDDSKNKKEALIVGVSDYSPFNRNDLSGIEKDISKMKSLFSSWGFNVKVIYDSDSMKILDYLDEYSKELDSDDYFAFYYSGHGSYQKDKNGDEIDGKDETIVLSDGSINKSLSDDILYSKFSKIKAKKMMFFDSCHSGTVFRTLNSNIKPKSISPDDITASFKLPTKMIDVSAVRTSSKDIIDGDYIAFSASQDNEESLATPSGSLFTNALYKVFSDKKNLDKPLDDIKEILVEEVVSYAKKLDKKPHHPNISFSDKRFSNKSLNYFLTLKEDKIDNFQQNNSIVDSNRNSLEILLDKLVNNNKVNKFNLSSSKDNYKEGESVEFELDTEGDSGFLTIFYVDKKDITILYPNPYISYNKKVNGKYKFPNDLSNGKFRLEAYKSCKGCDSERTVIYALLTDKPIDKNQIKGGKLTSIGKKSFEEEELTRAVKVTVLDSKEFKPKLGKYEFIVK